MTDAKATFSTTCRTCGHELPPGAETCPGCGKATPAAAPALDPWSEWSKTGKTIKNQWIASVLTFWVSVVVLGVLFYIENRLNLIVLSIIFGMLILGVWLKTRYQLHQRKEPPRPSQDVRAD